MEYTTDSPTPSTDDIQSPLSSSSESGRSSISKKSSPGSATMLSPSPPTPAGPIPPSPALLPSPFLGLGARRLEVESPSSTFYLSPNLCKQPSATDHSAAKAPAAKNLPTASARSDKQKAVAEFFDKHRTQMLIEWYPKSTQWDDDQKNIMPEDIIWHAMRKPPKPSGCWPSRGNRTAQILKNVYDTDVSTPPENIESKDNAAIFCEAYQNVCIEKELVAQFFKQHDISRAETLGKFGLFLPFSKWSFLSKEKRKNVRFLTIINHAHDGSKSFFGRRYTGTRTINVLHAILPTIAHLPLNTPPEIIALKILEQAKREKIEKRDSILAKPMKPS